MTTPASSFDVLAAFLGGGRLTEVVSNLEHSLDGCDASAVVAAVASAGIDDDLLMSALVVRQHIGRINDLIHAAAISLALPLILEPGERVTNRPSLAAGNDPSRPFDVETELRVAEFKVSFWSGTDAMRKRNVFWDLVHLAADQSGRRAELYVVGPAPIRFLKTSRSTAKWALNRGSESTGLLFAERFGSLDTPIRDFTKRVSSSVTLVDLSTLIPSIRTIIQD